MSEDEVKPKRTAAQVGGVHSPKNRYDRAIRDKEIVTKRFVQKYSIDELVEEYGLSRRSIYLIISNGASVVREETKAEMRQEIDAQIEGLARNLWMANELGDVKATKVANDLIRTKSKLFGLDESDAKKANAAALNAISGAANIQDMVALIKFVVDKFDISDVEKAKLPQYVQEGIVALGLSTFVDDSVDSVDDSNDEGFVVGEVVEDD